MEKGIGIFDLIVKLKKCTTLVQRGETAMHAIINEYCNEVYKESDCTKEKGGNG